MPGGQTPGVGELHRQPELANTLQAIAENGRDAFYFGEIAEYAMATVNSFSTTEDF